jgi:hypothetical protein
LLENTLDDLALIGVFGRFEIDHLKQGRVPNVFAERGWKAEWEHNRSDLFRRNLLRALIVTALVAYYGRKGADS